MHRTPLTCRWRCVQGRDPENPSEAELDRWIEVGVLDQILAALAREADLEWLMIDSTIVRAHQHAAGARGKKGGGCPGPWSLPRRLEHPNPRRRRCAGKSGAPDRVTGTAQRHRLRAQADRRLRPGLDQRAADREMIRAGQPLHPRLRKYRAQELGRDVALKQALAVLRERRVIPRRIVNADADKPTKQQVELQPLHQLPLRADRIERLQQHRPQQLLRRDRRPATPRIKR